MSNFSQDREIERKIEGIFEAVGVGPSFGTNLRDGTTYQIEVQFRLDDENGHFYAATWKEI